MTRQKSTYADNYRLVADEADPNVKLQISPEFLKDLMKRSKENGRTIEVEIALRLARSLEDIDILESDLHAVREKERKDQEKRAKTRLKNFRK